MSLRTLWLAAFAVLAAHPALAQQAASAQQKPAPKEEVLEFETVHSYVLDLGEIGSGWGLVSIYPNSYQVGLEKMPELERGEAAFIRALPGGNYAQGDLMQSVAAQKLAGTRIRTSAHIRNQGDGFAVFWMNAFSGDGRILSTVNKKLVLNTGWQPEELILDVPANAGMLEIGVSLQGTEGAGIWVGPVTLEVSDNHPYGKR
jgi:hypothetical protein